MNKLGFVLLFPLIGLFGEDFSFQDYRPPAPTKEGKILRYVSVDIAAIRNLTGVINVGLRKEAEVHGYDFGLSNGRSSGISTSSLYGSYLWFLDSSEKAKYYTGVGARSGVAWWSSNYVINTQGNFSAGRSYGMGDAGRQFFEVSLQWPEFLHFRLPVSFREGDKYRQNYSNFRSVAVSLFYGWMF